MPRLLMILPHAFHAGWLAHAPRLYDLVTGLQPLGWETALITDRLTGGRKPSEVEEAFPGQLVRVPFYMGPWPMFLDMRGVRRFWLWGCQVLRLRGLLDDPERAWPVRLRHWPQIAEACGGRPDLVWGISCGYLDGIPAARELSRIFNRPYLLELQDPVPPPKTSLNPWEERALAAGLAAAAAVVTTTHALAKYLEASYPCCRGKTATVYLSYDESAAAELAADRKEASQLVLLHAGRLHGGERRNARGLVRGLARAAEFEPDCRGRMSLHLVGEGAGLEEAVRLAEELGLPGAVVASPPVPPREAHRMMREADVLTVIKYQDPAWNMQIPGKLFSYLPFGKPILGIMGECEAADILRCSGLGVVVAHEDVGGIARALLDLWRNRDKLEQRFKPDREYVAQFSRSSMATKVDRILRDILERRGGA